MELTRLNLFTQPAGAAGKSGSHELNEGRGPRRPAIVHLITVPVSLRFLTGQLDFVRRCGFDIHVISSPGEELVRFGSAEGAFLHEVPMSRSITPLRDLVALFRIWRLLRRIQPVLVDAHTPKAGLLGMIAAWLERVPARIYHMHGLPFLTRTGFIHRLLRGSEWVSSLLSTEVLCESPSNREVGIAERVCPADKIKVLLGGSANGIDTNRFRPDSGKQREKVRGRLGIPADAFVIGFVGRIVREKGVSELVTAWRVLASEFPRVYLLVIGPFEPQDPVPEDTAKSLCSEPQIHLVGLDWETPPWFSAMDVLALPSYREGLGTVSLEAASMGLPVVATRVPGCTDAVVDGVTGTLVPPRDANAVADALRLYLTQPELRRAHGSAGRGRIIQDFRQEAIWSAMANEYRELLTTRGVPWPGDLSVAEG